MLRPLFCLYLVGAVTLTFRSAIDFKEVGEPTELVSGLVKEMILPYYPYAWIKAGYSGTVEVRLFLNGNGAVDQCKLVQHSLDTTVPAAVAISMAQIDVLRNWKFISEGGKPAGESVLVRINYSIEDAHAYCPGEAQVMCQFGDAIDIRIIGYRAIPGPDDQELARFEMLGVFNESVSQLRAEYDENSRKVQQFLLPQLPLAARGESC